MIINFIEAPLLAFILAFLVRYFNTDDNNSDGYVFFKNENLTAYMFMSVVVALFLGLTVSAEEIIRDRKIRKRESFLNLSKGSYLWSKIIIMFSLSALQTLLFVLVGNSILGVKDMFTDYWLILFTTSCFANMLGLNISSAFNSAVTIYILIPFLIIPQLLLAGVVVKFDKLNPILAKQGGVPWVGEMMASRWAFEALAVNQFKENKFEVNFYKFDKVIQIAEYKKNFWKQKIEGKISAVNRELGNPLKKEQIEKDLALIKFEISKEISFLKHRYKFDNLERLNIKDYTIEVSKSLSTFLDLINEHYIKRQNKMRDEREEVLKKIQKTIGNENYIKLQQDYENEGLTNLVKNANDMSGIACLEKDGRLIQRTDPIFADPTESNIGGAHFYAPTKRFMGKLIPTYWFNIAIIWLMSISLMVMLYFDVFKKVLDSLGNINFKKGN